MLFKTDIEFQDYSSLSVETFLAIKSIIPTVESKHLIPLLGMEQYQELQTAFYGTDPLTDRIKKLLDLARRVVAPWVAVYYTPKTDVKVSEGGVRRAETEKLKTAFQYQLKNFVDANRNEAMDAAEALLQFLEANAADYPLWRDGNGNKEYRKLFIKTATEFNTLFATASPHSNFMILKTKMVDVEDIHIQKTIGSTIFQTLKTKTTAPGGTLTDKETELLFAIKKAIAAMTVSAALPFIHVKMDEGLTAAGGSFGQNDALSSRVPVSDNTFSYYLRSVNDSARLWLDRIKKIIKDNPTDFPQPEAPPNNPITYKSLFGL